MAGGRLGLALLLLAAGLLALFAFQPIWDIDLFWHLAAGRWMLTHLAWPSTDILGFDPARTWVSFQWGYEVLVALLDRWGGLGPVRLLHVVVSAGAFLLFVLLVRARQREAGQGGALWAWFLLALLFALWADRVRVRPHVFNLFFEAALLLQLLRVPRSPLALLGLFLTMFAWANLHAGGAFIFLVLALALPAAAVLLRLVPGAAARWTAAEQLPLRALGAWGVLALACLASPCWVGGVLQASNMLEGSELIINEWLPFWSYFSIASHPLHLVSALGPLLTLGVVLWRLVGGGRGGRLDLWLLALGLALLPFRSNRFVYCDALALALLLPGLPRPSGWGRGALGVGAAALLVLTFQYHTVAQFGSVTGWAGSLPRDLDQRRFPVELADRLEGLGLSTANQEGISPKKIFCLPNWGGYLLYRAFPAVLVFSDGRGNFDLDTATRLQFVYDYRHVPEYGPTIEKIYNESGADLVVLQHPVFPQGYQPKAWQLLFEDPKGAVWGR